MEYKKLFCSLFVGVVFGVVEFASANPVYVFHQADGTIRFSTSKPSGSVKTKVFTAKSGSYSTVSFANGVNWKISKFYQQNLYKDKYDSIIRGAAIRHRVDPALVKAVIHAESRFNPLAVSRAGAMGLMQLMPSTARGLGVRKPFAINDNIEGGVKYLSKLLKLFNGNLKHCIAAYNAGEGAVAKYGGIPPYRETRNYVQKVMLLLEKYRA